MLRTIRGQILLLITIYTFFIITSAVITYIAVADHRKEENQIDLLNRQSLLVHKISEEAYSRGASPKLNSLIMEFERNNQLMTVGGNGVDENGRPIQYQPIDEGELLLGKLAMSWGLYQQNLNQLVSIDVRDPTYAPARIMLQGESMNLFDALVALSGHIEAGSQFEHLYLVYLQFFILALAVPLFYLGLRFSQRRIIKPLAHLNAEAKRIGEGQLAEPVAIINSDEIGDLASAIDEMRWNIAQQHSLLESRISERTRQLETAFNFSQEIVQQLNLNLLFESAVQKIKELMRVKSVSLCLVTEDHAGIELVASTAGKPAGEKWIQPIEVEYPLLYSEERAARNAEVSSLPCTYLRSSPQDMCLAIPLLIGDHALGTICIIRSPDEQASEQDINALNLYANSIAIAIENNRLIEQIQSQIALAARQKERERFAAELHDSLSQTLGVIRLQTGIVLESFSSSVDQVPLQLLENLLSQASNAQEQLRLAISGGDLANWLILSDPAGELSQYVDGFYSTTNVPVTIDGDVNTLRDLPAIVQKQAFLIIREALINIKRHAQAQSVKIRFLKMGASIQIEITDDGQGFDTGIQVGDSHLGLRIMRTRAERSGGTFQIHSQPGMGTTITVCFPGQKQQDWNS